MPASVEIPISPQQELLSNQVLVLEQVRELLQNNPKKKVLVILGLSGVGKTELAKQLLNEFSTRVKVLEQEQLQSHPQIDKTLIILAPANEVTMGKNYPKELQTRLNSPVTTIKLQGLDQEEMLAYLQKKHKAVTSTFPAEEMAELSLGLPYLAQQLARQDMTRGAAAMIVAEYLAENFPNTTPSILFKNILPQLLKMKNVPEDVQKQYRLLYDMPTENKMVQLTAALARRDKLHAEGIIEESPLFLAPQSWEMYARMIKKSESPSEEEIDIFVPHLSKDDADRLQEALFPLPTNAQKTRESQTRLGMFLGVNLERKVGLWLRKPDTGVIEAFESECPELSALALNYPQTFLDSHRTEDHGGAFLLHIRNHRNLTSNPIKVGWMVESLLQQRGIHYFGNNTIAGNSYEYDPETQQLKITRYAVVSRR